METNPPAPLKLNLGCGQNPRPGYVNVDKFGAPDVKCDLEVFPWPWEDSSVDEIVLEHVLEHLGETVSVYLGIIKELYRVCKHQAKIHVIVPHPRHDAFLGDPTHVRAFVPTSFACFSKAHNRECAEKGWSNSPLGLYLDVDLVTGPVQMDLDQPWLSQLLEKKITHAAAMEAANRYNNVVKQIRIQLTVNKPD